MGDWKGPRLQAAHVPEGSIVLLTGVDFGEDLMGEVIRQLVGGVGHEKFALIVDVGDGGLEVWGPDTDLEAKVRELFDAEREVIFDSGRPADG